MNAVPPGFRPDSESSCANEPIHRPGGIQPHGVLFVCTGGTARAASANAPGPTVADLLVPADAGRVTAALLEPNPAGTVVIDDLLGLDGRAWLALLHTRDRDEPSLLEFEPARPGLLNPLLWLDDAIGGLQAATTVASACAVVAAALASCTGFDRVMSYRFLPDWSGEVLAEHRSAGTGSFQGLRFPASDIPVQARALYAAARVRAIPDSQAAPVPLRPGVDPALDLTPSTLRAVSPLHLMYLSNMGVRASMSVAVVTAGGALWGLLACHHEAGPLFVPHPVRRAADTLARALGWRVAELDAAAAAGGRERVGDLREALTERLIDPALSVHDALHPLLDRLEQVVGAHDVLIAGPEGAPSFGLPAVQPGLAEALEAAAAATVTAGTDRPDRDHVVAERAADTLPGPVADALERAGHAGLLAMRLSDGADGAPGSWVAWLRRELRREVVWAGNPDKNVIHADDIRSLSPRHSFAAWRDEVAGRAAPFSPADLAAAAALADALTRALLRRAEAAERVHADLRRRNEDIRFFADAAVHDLREPLWQIQVFSGMLREELASPPAGTGAALSELHDMAQIVESSAVRMRQLIDELSHFAAVGRRPDRLAPEPVADMVDEAAADVGEQLRACGGTLRLHTEPGSSPRLSCDRVQIRRLLQNLFSNAIKYRDPGRTLLIDVTWSAPPGNGAGHPRIEVADNGLGFDPAEAERMFEPFRRLTQTSAVEGMGLGLAICRRIADGHGGSIRGIGRPGTGARFVVELPNEDTAP